MPIKKSELYSRLWQSCDELRGGMDASEYKNYILVLLFIKYVSDKFAGQPHAEIKVPRGASFRDMERPQIVANPIVPLFVADVHALKERLVFGTGHTLSGHVDLPGGTGLVIAGSCRRDESA